MPMSIQRFSLATLNRVKQQIEEALALTCPPMQAWVDLDESEDPPEPKSLDDLSYVFALGGLSSDELILPDPQWKISTVNPAAALLRLPYLWLKPDLRWVGYLYQGRHQSKGVVFAVPAALSTTAWLEKALLEGQDLEHPPLPQGALEHYMDAIDGDPALLSFLIASILQRELQEFGGQGSHCQWIHHRLIGTIPPQVKWRWQGEPAQDLSPKVKVVPDGQAATEFFSYRVQTAHARPAIVLYRHLNHYRVGCYRSRGMDKPIAIAYR